jgi:hypothetical protein
VPALVYAVGAYGFFALPYIIVHPFVFTVMPVLWRVAKTNGYVTAADVVHERYGSRALELAVAGKTALSPTRFSRAAAHLTSFQYRKRNPDVQARLLRSKKLFDNPPLNSVCMRPT